MKTTLFISLLTLCISNCYAQISKIVYTVPTAGQPFDLKNDITSEGEDLYVVIESDLYVLTYDENNESTEVTEIISINSSDFTSIRNLFLTNDWFYFSTDNSRAIRRILRNDLSLETETLADNLLFPSALLVIDDKLYFADDQAIYKLDLNNLPATPELLIEDSRLPVEQTKLTIIGSTLYVPGQGLLFKINTLNDEIEEIQISDLQQGVTFVSVSDSKLLGIDGSILYLFDITDDSFTILGSISCDLGYACGGNDLTLVDSTLFISMSESPHVRILDLANIVYADTDNDQFGNPSSSLEVGGLDFTTGFVFDATDCDDNNPNVNPDQIEILNNGIDDDCDEETMDSETTSIQFLANNQVKIYPIPTSDILNIEIENAINFQGKIYDARGKLITTFYQNKVDLSGIPAGSYLLEVQDLNSSQKIVKHIVVTY